MKVLPQEIEVWYVIPAIRKELAICLVKDFGLSYEKVGSALGISKAAISQYHKNKRAAKVKLPEQALREVGKSCKRIVNKDGNSIEEIQGILDFMRRKNLGCEVCEKENNGVLEGCREINLNGSLRR